MNWYCELATVKSLNADVSRVRPFTAEEEGLMLETPAFKLFVWNMLTLEF